MVKDPEKRRAYYRIYYAANRKKKLEGAHIRYAANPKKYREAARIYRATDPEKYLLHCRAYCHANRERIRAHNLKRKYGISLKRYEELLAYQNGVCAICNNAENDPRKGRRLSTDHDHMTDEVRGLLCSRCNAALGLLEEDPKIIEKMFGYIINWRKHKTQKETI